MAAKEMYDYFTGTITANYTATTLTLKPQRILTEVGHKNQVVHIADDGTEERISLAATPIFYVTLQWDVMTESDSGTIFDFYFDAATPKADGMLYTFKWTHPTDAHTYVVRFDNDLTRAIKVGNIYSINEVRFKVFGISA